MEDVDFSGLEEVFRERFFRLLLRREKILPETVERFKAWEHSGFSANWERKIAAEDRQGLERLLTYMERPAVSLRRLRYLDDGMVNYQGSKFHPRLGIDHQLLSPVEFLALLVPHVLLRYEITLRLYGALSTTWRRKLGWIENPPVHSPPPEAIPLSAMLPLTDPTPPPLPPPPPPADSKPPDSGPDEDPDSLRTRKRSWAKLIQRTWKDDPQICSSCGKPMKLVTAIAPEQKDVIERILHSHNHNTNCSIITIYYSFHPLRGRQFHPVRTCVGPPMVHVVKLPERRLSIPAWMTEEAASALKLSDLPSVSAERLLEIKALLDNPVLDLCSSSRILTTNSLSEEDRDHEPIDPASPSPRPPSRGDQPPAGPSRRTPKVHGKAASPGARRRERKGG
jgi:hypothetical protein